MTLLLGPQDKGVIQCATFQEFQAVREAWGSPAEQTIGRRRFFERGHWICVRGSVGKVWAAATAEFVIHQWQPRALVDFGAAGGLVPELSVGDLVIATKVIEHDVESAIVLKKPFVNVAVAHGFYEMLMARPDSNRSGVLHRGVIASGDRDIHTVDQRRQLAKDTGALAATWESSAIGRVAGFHGIPFYSLRVITDVGAGSSASSNSGKEFLQEYTQSLERVLGPAAQALNYFCGF